MGFCDSLYDAGRLTHNSGPLEVDSILESYMLKVVKGNQAMKEMQLVTGEHENFHEYPILSIIQYSGETRRGTIEIFRHPMHFRLNVDGLTYYDNDNSVRSFIGLHRNEEFYTVVVPVLFDSKYFCDLHFTFEI